MSTAEDLGKLIITMNPYTDGSDGSMEPHTFIRADPSAAASAGPAGATPTPAGSGRDATCIWMEMDKYAPGDWTFKGQPHRIDTALRIAYRWKKTNGGETVWITDYLLIGYEGSNGG